MAIPTRRLPLNALRTFEAAARHLSFKNAAEELCVSPTTVSNQIRQLEKNWNCKLFHRRVRAIDLTEPGISLSRLLTRVFREIINEVEPQVASIRHTVKVGVGPIFGAFWLSSRLGKFRHDHPDIDLVVHYAPRLSRAGEMEVDIDVDWGNGDWVGLEATKLVDIYYSPIADPKFLNEIGDLSTPSDLARLPIIHQHDRREWRNWMQLAGCASEPFSDEVVISDSNVVLQAVKNGQGVALGVFPFLDGEVRNGQLIKLFDIDLHPDRSFYLLTRPEDREKRHIRAVCEWFERHA